MFRASSYLYSAYQLSMEQLSYCLFTAADCMLEVRLTIKTTSPIDSISMGDGEAIVSWVKARNTAERNQFSDQPAACCQVMMARPVTGLRRKLRADGGTDLAVLLAVMFGPFSTP